MQSLPSQPEERRRWPSGDQASERGGLECDGGDGRISGVRREVNEVGRILICRSLLRITRLMSTDGTQGGVS